MIKNSKGFVITEVLILSTVIIGLLVFMYIQFKNINRSYQYSFKYDTVSGMYLANNIVNYINENDYDTLAQYLLNSPEKYIDITECSTDYFSVSTYCEELFKDSKIEKILFTYEDIDKIDTSNLDEELKNYIRTIETQKSQNDYRIIVKYKDNTYATMRFNKEDVYVQKGLIAYLDGINNTGYGHLNETTTWKDLSGHNNDATLYNNPTWSNNSLTFDGLTNYARLENTANMTFANGITWEIRVKSINEYIFSNWENGGEAVKYRDNELNIAFGTFDTNSSLVDTRITDASYNNENFHTITFTYDNQNIKYYCDGNLIDTRTLTNSVYSPSAPFTLGGNPKTINTTLDSYGSGEVQNVLIYDRALTDEEIMKNYQVDIKKY